MLHFDGYPYPLIPVTGQVVTSGLFGDLKDKAGKVHVGIFDAKTYGVATGAGNGKEFFIGYSSEHTRDAFTKFYTGMQQPKKTEVFAGKDVLSFEYSNPQRIQNEEWVLGFDGSPSSKSLKFEKGRSYGFVVSLEDLPVWRVMGHSLRHEVWIHTDPIADPNCTDGCDDGVDCQKYTNQIVDALNNHIGLKPFGLKASTVRSNYSAPANTINIYNITLTDGGGPVGDVTGSDQNLANVQASAGRLGKVKRIASTGLVSTYEVCSVSLPPAITPDAQVLLAECDECPTGYTASTAQDTWVITRPLAGTENFTSDANRDTYADTVGTAYSVATDADKIFLGTDGSTAKVQIRVAPGTVVTALLADTVEKAASTEVYCVNNVAPVAVAWTDTGDDAYRAQRTLTINLPRVECEEGSNRLAEVTAYVSQFPDYVAGSITTAAGTCSDDYTITQWSTGCADAGCLSVENSTFNDFPGYEGNFWKTTPVNDLPETGVKCGIRITAGYVDTVYGNCSFDPNDFHKKSPIRLQINQLSEYHINGTNGIYNTPQEIALLPEARKTKSAQEERQSGESIVREYIKGGAYEAYGEFDTDPRMREAKDSGQRLNQIQRDAFYKIYYIKFRALRGDRNWYEKGELFTTMVVFKESEQAKANAFEAAFAQVLGKFGVVLKQRDI